MTCEHVYKTIGKDICPDCNRPTHETDFKAVAAAHKEWIESGQAKPQGWWSI